MCFFVRICSLFIFFHLKIGFRIQSKEPNTLTDANNATENILTLCVWFEVNKWQSANGNYCIYWSRINTQLENTTDRSGSGLLLCSCHEKEYEMCSMLIHMPRSLLYRHFVQMHTDALELNLHPSVFCLVYRIVCLKQKHFWCTIDGSTWNVRVGSLSYDLINISSHTHIKRLKFQNSCHITQCDVIKFSKSKTESSSGKTDAEAKCTHQTKKNNMSTGFWFIGSFEIIERKENIKLHTLWFSSSSLSFCNEEDRQKRDNHLIAFYWDEARQRENKK